MENQLNSIILEGIVIVPPDVIGTSKTGEKVVKFTLKNYRYTETPNGYKEETLLLAVRCCGELGQKAIENVHEGMEVRAVGHLAAHLWRRENGEPEVSTEIVCNHIEYRVSKTKVLDSEN